MPSVQEIYKFDELTWPEINEAVALGKIPILPTGSVEQHGHHLCLNVDHLCANAVATEAARRRPKLSLVMPPVTYGYVHHVMDFPGSINIHYEHFTQYVLDICKSLAYHGFKKIILINGHGSNHNLVDMVARRVIVETDASCVFCSWWQLLQVNPGFDKRWRESVFPGGALMPANWRLRCSCTWPPSTCARTGSRASWPRPTRWLPSSSGATFLPRGPWG